MPLYITEKIVCHNVSLQVCHYISLKKVVCHYTSLHEYATICSTLYASPVYTYFKGYTYSLILILTLLILIYDFDNYIFSSSILLYLYLLYIFIKENLLIPDGGC